MRSRCSSGSQRCSWSARSTSLIRMLSLKHCLMSPSHPAPLSTLQEDDAELVQQWLAAVQLAQVGMDRLVGTLELIEGEPCLLLHTQ